MSQSSRVIAAILVTCGLCVSPARATYSIAAVDQSTQQVGGAVTSCVGSLDVGVVFGAVPGVGVIHAQAALDRQERAKKRALQLLMQGVAPPSIIKQITAQSFDAQYASRQYGIVDLMGRSAGFTGAQAQDYKRDQQGKVSSFAYSVQGNILTSQKVLDQAAGAFEAGGCDLADRLMRALEAGANNGEGDVRCTRPSGIPSDSAFIEVDLPEKPGYLKLSVSGTGSKSPLPALRMLFDDWRKTHPCSVAGGGAGASAAGAGGNAGGQSGAAAMSGSFAGASGTSASGGVSAMGAPPAAASGTSASSWGNAGTAGIPAPTPGLTGGAGAASTSAGQTAAISRSAVSPVANKPSANGGAGTASQTQSAVTTQPASNSNAQPPSASSSGCAVLSAQPSSKLPLALFVCVAWLWLRARKRRARLDHAPDDPGYTKRFERRIREEFRLADREALERRTPSIAATCFPPGQHGRRRVCRSTSHTRRVRQRRRWPDLGC